MRNISQETTRKASEGLRAIAHEIRLSILFNLMDGPMSSQELVTATGTSQSNLSQHLAKMRMSGIVMNERRGQQMFYKIANTEFADLVVNLCRVYCPHPYPPKK